MCHYGICYLNLNFIKCTYCGTQAFEWMAEAFACPTCGWNKYVFPMFAADDIEKRNEETEAKVNQGTNFESDGTMRKRKRPPHDEKTTYGYKTVLSLMGTQYT